MTSCWKAAAAAAIAVSATYAQISLPPGFFVASTTSGASLGIPGPLGGIEWSADGSILYVGGSANDPAGAVYAVPATRDPITLEVLSFGPATFHAAAFEIDGGLEFGPGGTLFHTAWPSNQLGQITSSGSFLFPLDASTDSVGGLTFGQVGTPYSGVLFVSSYDVGDIFTVPLTSNANGTFTPGTPILWATLPFGSEGIRFIPSGPNQGDLVVTNFSLGTVAIVDVDPLTGDPVGGAANPTITTFATGIGGAEGFAFDPLTNDFFVSTYNGSPSNSIIRISGFPAPTSFPLAANTGVVSAAFGGVVTFTLLPGTAFAGSGYALLIGASGSAPGFTLDGIPIPLNPDDLTSVGLSLANTSTFQNFVGTVSGGGSATATLVAPTIPPAFIGTTFNFAAATFFGGVVTAASTSASVLVIN
jgi:hypothetical protein